MEFGKRFVRASALTATVAMATIVGTASADLRPPKADAAAAATTTTKSAAAALAPAVPTFVNGMAQNVFSTNRADWVVGEVWVESNFDSDRDGKPDRIHADYTLPRETMTDGLKVPVIYEDSPYFAGTGGASNWPVDHELGLPPAARAPQTYFAGRNTSPDISNDFETAWLPRGFGVVHSESPGSGHSEGCPTSGATNETLGATVVIDWLNGRRKAYTSRTGTVEAAPVNWHNGKTAMMGTSYNGTIPVAAATTGVDGLAAIVPIAAITDWYDYYRANGAVRAPHSETGGTGTNDFQGEELDVLADLVYSRRDEGNPRTICRAVIDEIIANVDRKTGDRSAFWQERNYMKDVAKVKAATLIAHGGNDFNVMTKNAAQLFAALKAQGTPRMFYFHQGGHGGAPPDFLTNLWFTKYLWGVDNGVENLPKSWVVRNEPGACPARESTVTTEASNTATLVVANATPFRVGTTLTIPQTNANGTITNTTRVITNIAGNTLTLVTPVATTAGQRVVAGATVSLVCGNANPTPYADWPDPGSSTVTQRLGAGGASRGALGFTGAAAGTVETLTDNASIADTALRDAASSPNRLIYQTNALTKDIRISGTPTVSLNVAFSKPKANLSAALVSYPATGGAGTIITRGWKDPENRTSDFVSDPITPGAFYQIEFDMQAKDAVIPAGNRLALMVFSSDREYTIRPAAGTQVSLDVGKSSFTIPVVGGQTAVAAATGAAFGDVSGTVPATLSLSLGAPASFGAFTPGVARDYTATTMGTVVSSAGDATLSVADPSSTHTGKLVNGSFALPQTLQARARTGAFAPVGGSSAPTTLLSYTGPISNDQVPIEFKQSIGANDALRTGTYSKTLTFTLSTTQP